ncbi:hypothetical protein AgCh_004729 [Apium graveolens]
MWGPPVWGPQNDVALMGSTCGDYCAYVSPVRSTERAKMNKVTGGAEKEKKKGATFVIDYGKPVKDKIMDIASPDKGAN